MIKINKNGEYYSILDDASANVTFLTQQQYDLLTDEEKNNGLCYAVIDGRDREAINDIYVANTSLTYTGSTLSPNFQFYDSSKTTKSGTASASNAGSYVTYFEPKSGYCWFNGSTEKREVHWQINLNKVTLSNTDPILYSGSSQQPPYLNYIASQIDYTGTFSATNAGEYNVTFTPKEGKYWTDGTRTPVTIYWNILKCYQQLELVDPIDTDKYFMPNTTSTYRYIGSIATATSSDTSVATVSAADGVLTIQGNAEGSTTITLNSGTSDNTIPTILTIPLTVQYYRMTVEIDLSNSAPGSWATYKDDAASLSQGDAKFDEFFGYYPVLLDSSGNELGKLNPNNFAQYEDGTSAPITTLGNDVMIAFPRRGFKISRSEDKLTVSLIDSGSSSVSGYSYRAHKYKNALKSKFYIGAYLGYVDSSTSPAKLYSGSGRSNTYSEYTLSNMRTYAHNRGSRYELMDWYRYLYIQVLYTIKYKAANSYTIFGGGTSSYSFTSGSLNSSGMNYGSANNTGSTKVFGLEYWITYSSNYYYYQERLEGILIKGPTIYICEDDNYSDTPTNYSTQYTYSSDIPTSSYYLKDPVGNNQLGFLTASTNSGSTTTYFCDYQVLNLSSSGTSAYCLRKSQSSYTNTGMYALYAYSTPSSKYGSHRLVYYPAS